MQKWLEEMTFKDAAKSGVDVGGDLSHALMYLRGLEVVTCLRWR